MKKERNKHSKSGAAEGPERMPERLPPPGLYLQFGLEKMHFVRYIIVIAV